MGFLSCSGFFPISSGVHRGDFLAVDFVPGCSGYLWASAGFYENAPVSGGAVAIAVVIVPFLLLEGLPWVGRASSVGGYLINDN